MAKAKIVGGVGPSKNFGAPEETRLKSGVDRLLAAHINGVLVSSLNLDPQVLVALDYGATDEGIAEKDKLPKRMTESVRGGEPFDKSLQQRRDDVKERDIPLYDARDPLKEVADKYAVPGQRAKFLSANRLKERGGTGEYVIVKDSKGDDVKVHGMVLGHCPEELAVARTLHYQKRGNALLKQIGESYKAEGGPTAVVDDGNSR